MAQRTAANRPRRSNLQPTRTKLDAAERIHDESQRDDLTEAHIECHAGGRPHFEPPINSKMVAEAPLAGLSLLAPSSVSPARGAFPICP